jgi:steroid delta-isomerase-like uncharacterized protein
MSEQNKILVRRIIDEVWNRGSDFPVSALIAKDYVGHSSLAEGETHGPEGYWQYFNAQRQAFPDIHYTVEDQITEGNRVVTRWTARATHLGEFQGVPPTARMGMVTGISIFHISNGNIVECWTSYDALGLLQQLGVMPAPR